MAFYNPQRVVFNPNTGVIQNAGKVGGVLYDIMSKNYDDKLKASQFEQEQNLKKQQMEFNQAIQNNQLMQNERNFDYQKERANIADQQWQMNYNQRARQFAMQNALRQQEINANKPYKDLNYQKGLLEFQKLQNEINAKQKEQDLLNGIFDNNQGFNNSNNKNILNDIRYKADAQFLDLASNQGKTYDTTHGFWNGAIERGFGGWGSQSTDLNDASDLFLKRMQSDLLRGGKNAKWNLENIQANFPINGYNMEANNQRVAQALAGEWLSEAPNAFKMELAERLGSAKTNIEKQSAIEEYQKNMAFYNNYAPKVKAFYWDEKISKPRNSIIIGDENGVLGTREINAKELIEENMQKYKNHLMPGTPAGFVPFVSSSGNVILQPKDKKINLNGKNAYITRPDATGNIAIELESGEVIQSTMSELKKLGVIK